jgi:polyphenol oxidase
MPYAVSQVRCITEAPAPETAPGLHVHGDWAEQMPWLVQGTTSGADMSLFGGTASGVVMNRWLELRDRLRFPRVVHARQVHAANVVVHADVLPGILVAGDADGHATAEPGTLLTVSVADCVPIFIAAPDRRAIALLHGGWRGVAAGILERGVALLRKHFGVRPESLRVHFGPAICGDCYEVGAEVTAGLGLATRAGHRAHVDLRAVLADRARSLGLPTEAVSYSSYCTRCGDSPFFSHRAGCRERQLGVLGIRTVDG